MNDYFTAPTAIPNYTPARASNVNEIATGVEEAFEKLPSLGDFSLSIRKPVTVTGTPNALVMTNTDPLEAYVTGQRITLRTISDNTGPVTINVDGLGAKAIKTDAGENLVAQSLRAGGVYDVVYDGTSFQIPGSGAAVYAAQAAQAVVDAKAQVALAAGQVTLAAGQVTLAAAEADEAATFSVSAGNSATAAAASAAAAAASAIASKTWDPSSYYNKTETDSKIAAISGSAPAGLNSIEELANAIDNDPTFSTTVNARLDQVEADVDTNGLIVGEVIRTYGIHLRTDLIAADGAYKSKATYPDLYAAMYGARNWPGFPMNPADVPAHNATVANYQFGSKNISWRPDGTKFAVGTIDGFATAMAVYDWNGGAPTKLAALPGDPGDTRGVAWSPSGRYLAVATGNSPYSAIWDWNTGSPVKLANPAVLLPGNGLCVAWSPNGRYVAFGHDAGGGVRIYDMQSGAPVAITDPTGIGGYVFSIAWSPSGRYMACAHNGAVNGMDIYDWQSGAPVHMTDPVVPPGGNSGCCCVAWSPDSRYLIAVNTDSGGSEPAPRIYDMNSGVPVSVGVLPSSARIGSAMFSPDGTKLAVTGGGSILQLFTWAAGVATAMDALVSTPGNKDAVAWSPDGAHLVVGGSKSSGTSIAVMPFLASVVQSFQIPTITTTNPPTYIKALP